MVPLQSSMTATLPGSYFESDSREHDPFPGDQPMIMQFEDKVLHRYSCLVFNPFLVNEGGGITIPATTQKDNCYC